MLHNVAKAKRNLSNLKKNLILMKYVEQIFFFFSFSIRNFLEDVKSKFRYFFSVKEIMTFRNIKFCSISLYYKVIFKKRKSYWNFERWFHLFKVIFRRKKIASCITHYTVRVHKVSLKMKIMFVNISKNKRLFINKKK